jgi:ribA/ribD-fused uncharacterized protein
MKKYALSAGHKSAFSNMHPSAFRLWKKDFSNAEQAYVYAKAMTFKDIQIAEAVMRTDSGYEARKLGKMIAGFDKQKWDGMQVKIMKAVVMQKFLHCEKVRNLMLQKYKDGYSFVHVGGPYAVFWSNGLSEEKSQVVPPAEWPGRDMLGQILNETAEYIFNLYDTPA